MLIKTLAFKISQTFLGEGSLYGLTAKVLDSEIFVCKFEPQAGYNAHFKTNALGKGMKFLIPNSY